MRVDFRKIHSAPPRFMPHLMGMGDVCQPLGAGTAEYVDTYTSAIVDSLSDPICQGPNPVSVGSGTSVLGPPPPANLTIGCGGDLAAQLYNVAAGLIAMPQTAQGQSASEALMSAAEQLCAESGDGGAFGCPPMSGCDPAGMAALVAQYAPLVDPAVTQYQTSGAWAPTATSTPTPVYTPTGSIPASPGAPAVTSSPSSSSSGSSGTSGSTSTSTSTTDWLTQSMMGGIPNWALLAGGAAIVLVVVSMMGKK